MEKSVVTQHVQQLRRSASSPHYAEHGQHCVPDDERAAQLKSTKKQQREQFLIGYTRRGRKASFGTTNVVYPCRFLTPPIEVQN